MSTCRPKTILSGIVAAVLMLGLAQSTPTHAAVIAWTLSPEIPLSDGGRLNGYFGIDEYGYTNGTAFELTTAGGSPLFNMAYLATINAINPNELTVQFVAPDPAYSSLLQLTFAYSLLIPRLNNPIVGGIGGPSFECEGYSCLETNMRFVAEGQGFANANPLPAAVWLLGSVLAGGLGFGRWRKRRTKKKTVLVPA